MTRAERRAIEIAERDGSLEGFADLLAAEYPDAAEYLRGRCDPAASHSIRTKAAIVLAYQRLRRDCGITGQMERLDLILLYATSISIEQALTAVRGSDAAVERFLIKNPNFDYEKHLTLNQTFFDPDRA